MQLESRPSTGGFLRFQEFQWRYKGDTSWNNLIAISEFKGADGAAGVDGVDGANDANDPAAGGTELRAHDGRIQWRTAGGEWKSLYRIADANGAITVQAVRRKMPLRLQA